MDCFQRYRQFVLRNGHVLALAETGLSTLTWLLPDRFTDNELSLEAIHTCINLISALHDAILNEPAPDAPPHAPTLTFLLSALQQTQVLVELWGLYSEKNHTIDSRYDPLIAIEGFKALVRLAILRSSGCRVLCNGGTTTFDPEDSMALPGQRAHRGGSVAAAVKGNAGAGSVGEVRAKQVFSAFAAFRNKHCFPSPPPPTKSTTKADRPSLWWWDEKNEKEEEGDSPMPPPTTTTTTRTNAMALKDLERYIERRQATALSFIIAGELIHILRPLIYVAALRSCRGGRRSWKPWAISLVLELASSKLGAMGASASHAAAAEAAQHPAVSGTGLSILYASQGVRWRRDEADEMTRRKLMLLYSLLRDPFFSKVTGPAVERWQRRLGGVPLVGRLIAKGVELLLGVQKYYTYTSGS